MASVMDRRAFIGTVAGGLLAAPLVAEAQSPGRMPRIGVLLPAEPASPTEPNASAFRQGLRELGYVEGQNIAIEYRYAHGRSERYAELAHELVRPSNPGCSSGQVSSISMVQMIIRCAVALCSVLPVPWRAGRAPARIRSPLAAIAMAGRLTPPRKKGLRALRIIHGGRRAQGALTVGWPTPGT